MIDGGSSSHEPNNAFGPTCEDRSKQGQASRRSIVDDKLTESRDLYGRQHLPHLFSGEVDEKQSEIRKRYLQVCAE